MEQITSRDGTTIGYRRSGSGPPLVLVHGTTANHGRWARITPQFEQHFTVYAMDRRGRGASGDSQQYDLQREAEDVAALVDAIGEPTFVLGHSYGGLVSLEAALLTQGIRRLILYEPPVPTGEPINPPGIEERVRALVDEGKNEAALELFFREVVRMPEKEFEIYRQLPTWKDRVTLAPTIPREMRSEDQYRFQPEKFANLETPVLLMQGGDSSAPFHKAIKILASALPNAQTVTLEGQQHVAMDMNPDLFVREVKRFLLD